jgi:hypothetical protein
MSPWISVEFCDRSNVLGRAFSPAALAQSRDCWPDLLEPFSAILDRGTPDFDEPMDPNRSERNNNR